ncbi:MAG: TetR/AcrR family transcriptional regulator [Deltaproteobacteria bacterium]|nr:TetR/AcrR family transcriptional regulator [Deltaproteobacteria bacterium]
MNKNNEVKERIIEESIKAFLSRGFRGTTTKELTDAAGVAKGTLYWHFKSKDEILDAILEKFFKEFIGGIKDAVDRCSGNFLAKFKTFFKFGSEFSRDNRELMLVFQTLLGEIAGTNSEAAMKMKAIQNNYDHFVQMLLDQGKKEGLFGWDMDTYIQARIMTATLMGSYLQWYLYADQHDAEYDRRYALALRKTLLKGIGVEIDRDLPR